MGHCDVLTPPGRCVYQRDNYRIWEVDGARESVSLQPLEMVVADITAVLPEPQPVWQALH
jgi:hypothetical protein